MITILMAAKTGVEYMSHAIGSVLAQSYTDWELVIGINGLAPLGDVFATACRLTDPWREKIAVWDFPDCANKASALNEMVRVVFSEWVAILDVDDLWHPFKLQRQIESSDGRDVVGTAGTYFGLSTGDIGVPSGPITLETLKRSNAILNSSAIMRRQCAVWEPMDEPIEDYELWLRLAANGKKLFNLPEHLTFIRQHQNQWSRKASHDITRLQKRYA